MSVRLHRGPLVACLLPSLCAGAAAQRVIHTFDGVLTEDHFGSSVAGQGDVNNDGFPDLIVGIPSADPNGDRSGAVQVLSGLDGTLLWEFFGEQAGDAFGTSVASAGDVDGDMFDDILIGAPFSDAFGPDAGRAQVFSGQSGMLLLTFDGGAPGDRLGSSVDGAGRVDADLFDDVILGAPGADFNGFGSGLARVHSGADGSLLHALNGDAAGDALGISVAGAGDVDGDGFADVIAGASGDDDNGSGSGSARVVSGQTGATLLTLLGSTASEFFGIAVDGAGDVDGDGFDDLLVGVPGDGTNGAFAGSARLFSSGGALMHEFFGDVAGVFFGVSVAGLGDVDGDGLSDVLIGGYLSGVGVQAAGMARVYRGLAGTALCSLYGDSKKDHLGFAVGAAGDVDGDGRADLIVGVRFDDPAGIFDAGSAMVVAGQGIIGVNYCGPAVPNSTLQPGVVTALGSEVVAAQDVTLKATQLPPKKFGAFLVAGASGFLPNPGTSQGTLCLSGTIGRYFKLVKKASPAGIISIQVDLNALPFSPNVAVQPGDTWYFQCWYRDLNPGNTSNFTDGVAITFQ